MPPSAIKEVTKTRLGESKAARDSYSILNRDSFLHESLGLKFKHCGLGFTLCIAVPLSNLNQTVWQRDPAHVPAACLP